MSALDDIKLYFFHHHHYLDVPADHERYRNSMVDYSNAHFDPVLGHELYDRHLRTLVRADELGFDGIAINEHHSMVYSMSPCVSLLAARLTRGDEDARILVAGTPINLSYPNRVSEEYAMLDVMSGGRMEYAFPLGHGHGVLVERGDDQPDDRARALPRVAGHHPQVVDRGRPDPLRRRVLQLPLPEPVAEAVPEAVPEELHRRHGQRGDGLARRRLRARLLDRLRPDPEPAAGVRADARARGGAWARRSPPTT